MNPAELKEFLDFKADEYNSPSFIATDPIQIPHEYHRKEDIEIIGFIVATIAWGNRTMIIRNGRKLMQIMGESPHDFVMQATSDQIDKTDFIHRTFNSEDLKNFLKAMKVLYIEKDGLESLFVESIGLNMKDRIIHFNHEFTQLFESQRTSKHVANPLKGSAAKRINMYLRWMCRKDNKGVDFGIWNAIDPSELHLPLDVHSGNIARKLGLLNRKQNDWKAVEELQEEVLRMDRKDPCKYDFALFGLGAFENF
ncbi:MAG: TIGR02757 family protein [Crocinitomicaceae bacterium]|nr:TIGR02757 family protein [Crocinitomicaceae bacterium]